MTGWIAGIIVLLFLAVVLGIVVIDSNRFVVVTYDFISEKIKENYNFVLISDLHNKVYGKDNSKLLDTIFKLQPEAVFIAGDMLTAVPGADFSTTIDFLKKISERYPVYYGNGNHEQRMRLEPLKYGSMYEDYQKELKKIGINPMLNQKVYLEKPDIMVYGAEIDKFYYKHFIKRYMSPSYLESLFTGNQVIDEESSMDRTDYSYAYKILIAHDPDYFEAYVKWGADLTLSGHIHGGVARLPILGGVISPSLRLFPKYDGGLFEKDGKKMVLSRGLGAHTIPLRFLNPGEVILIRLKKK